MDSTKDSNSPKSRTKLHSIRDANSSNHIPAPGGSRARDETLFTSPMPIEGNSTSSQSWTDHVNCVKVGPNKQVHKGSNIVERQNHAAISYSPSMSNVSHAVKCEATSSSDNNNVCENGLDTNDHSISLKHKLCQEPIVSSSNYNLPSTSGENHTSEASPKENRKRPSSLKLYKSDADEEDDSSSDTGNDDYSLGSEDGCIYTYRGGEHLADLPSSFFSLDMGLPLDRNAQASQNFQAPPQNVREQGSRASSPDMDFLEMDFDPGPSCEVDSGDESSPDADLDGPGNLPEEHEPVKRPSPDYVAVRHVQPVVASSSSKHVQDHLYSVPSTSQGTTSQGDLAEASTSQIFYGPYITHVNYRGEQLLVRRTMSHVPQHGPLIIHMSSGDLVSPRETLNYEDDVIEGFAHQVNLPSFDPVNLSSAHYHMTMAKKLVEKTKSNDEEQETGNGTGDPTAHASGCSSGAGVVEPPKSMIWSEREACERQVTQIGTSACGSTAVVNVFNALGIPVNIDKINATVATRLRANSAPLTRYLLSRAVAGCTAADLVNGIQKASDGLVTARFFPTHPKRAMSLSHWLADWISLGAVPILTLNLQAGCEGEIPDSWHHQMVFGVSPRGVYLCNPLECVRESELWPRLTSPSVLLVRVRDVIAHMNDNIELTPLLAIPDSRFHSFNVLGQVVNVMREWSAANGRIEAIRTRHIRIPASYQAGITVAALTGSEAHRRLMHSPQLPIVSHTDR